MALVPARGEEDAPLLPQSVCEPRHCADSGSGGCSCRARAAGARFAAPGWSLPGKCRERALNSATYFSPASSPSPLPAPRSPPGTSALPPVPPACGARPPLILTRARTAWFARSHSRRLALRRGEARATETTRPTAAGTAGAARWPGVTRRQRPRPAPQAPARAAAAAARDDGEQGSLPASRRGGARAQWA